MTHTATPAPATAAMIAAERVRNRAAAIDAHAHEVNPQRRGINPIDGTPTGTRDAAAIARTIDTADGFTALGQMAEYRERVASTLRFHPESGADRMLTDDQAQGLAFRAMAALNREADTRHRAGSYRPAYLTLIGDFFPVGPYVSHAVEWVLRDVEHARGDREVVTAWAVMLNVATR